VSELLVDPGRSIGALGLGVDGLDLLGQLGVGDGPGGGCAVSALVVGGTGDLERVTAVLDAVTCDFLRLDGGVHLHRVSFGKKAAARLSRSTSAWSRRFSWRRRDSSWRSSGVRPSISPASIRACSTHLRTAVLRQVEVPGHLADRTVAGSAALDDLSLELRGERPTRTGRSMVSILDIFGAVPLIVDVRQTGGGPVASVLV